MKTRWFTALAILTFVSLLGLHTVHAAATPVVGLFPGITQNAAPTLLGPGATKVGVLNSLGPTVFDLRNNSRTAIKSLLVTIEVGSPTDGANYTCSSLNQLLTSCRTEARGNVLYVLFSGSPEITLDGTDFRLGFAPADGGTPAWPSNRPVSVTVNGQLPPRG